MPRSELNIGSRGSLLAVKQREEVVSALQERNADLTIREVDITTKGDARRDLPVRSIGTSVFVSELQHALLSGEIDFAVHSLKDLPTTEPDGLTLAAVPYREDPRDAVITKDGATLDELPSGSVVATGSPRRAALTHIRRPDIVLHHIRGNVNTRIDHLDSGRFEIDALILAAAGLNRLGVSHRISQHLGCMEFVAAPAQGALALECRSDDADIISLCRTIQHVNTRTCVDAERSLVRELAAGCSTPIGAHAKINGNEITLAAFISNISATKSINIRESAEVSNADELASSIARQMLAEGAAELVQPSIHAN